jgi:hypothetical protein
MAFEIGTKIRVRFSGRVQKYNAYLNSTTEIQENGGFLTHFVYLGANGITGGKREGDTVQVAFDGLVAGPYKGEEYSTTRVSELDENGKPVGYTHYLYLDSRAVSVFVPAEITEPAKPEPAKPEPAKPGRPAKKERTTVSINSYDDIIEGSDVESRIDELEEARGYEVVRLRNDEVLDTFNDETEAESYIEDEDYNPERVIVRRQELDEDDAAELERLRVLRDAVGGSEFTLYRDDYFDADWARDQAREQLPRSVDLDDWPFSQIDWSDAASARRDEQYEYSYLFDGTTYYSAE